MYLISVDIIHQSQYHSMEKDEIYLINKDFDSCLIISGFQYQIEQFR